MSLVSNCPLNNSVLDAYESRKGVQLYREAFASPSELVVPCINLRSAKEKKYLVGVRKEREGKERIYKAFDMGLNQVAITSKTVGSKPAYPKGGIKTTREVTIYRYNPETCVVTEVGRKILLKARGYTSIGREIELLKLGTLPRTPPFIGTFTYFGRWKTEKKAYVSERFDGSVMGFYQAGLMRNKRLCLAVLIQVLEILDEWQNAGLIHLDMKPENFVYRLVGKYDVTADGTVYKTDEEGRLYKIAKEGKVYQVISGREHAIKKEGIVEIEVCVIDVASAQSAVKEIEVASWQWAEHTPLYASPEWITRKDSDKNPALAKHDIFSVGMMIYYMLVENHLSGWEIRLLKEMMDPKCSNNRVKEIKRLWRDLKLDYIDSNQRIWQVIAGMLKRDPRQRMSSAEALSIFREELVKNDPPINSKEVFSAPLIGSEPPLKTLNPLNNFSAHPDVPYFFSAAALRTWFRNRHFNIAFEMVDCR